MPLAKMLMEWEYINIHIPIEMSFGVIIITLILSIVLSVLMPKPEGIVEGAIKEE